MGDLHLFANTKCSYINDKLINEIDNDKFKKKKEKSNKDSFTRKNVMNYSKLRQVYGVFTT
jgi:predicted DNA-binding ribbon-helix-helix protein